MLDFYMAKNTDGLASLQLELRTGVKLEKLGSIICDGTHNFDPPHTLKHTVAMGLVNKALNTAQAIWVLVDKGCADDGMSLLRTLVEATINAGYIFLEGDGAAQNFSDYLQFRRWVDMRDLMAVDKAFVIRNYSKQELREIERKHDAVRDKFKDNPHDWAPRGVSVFHRAERLDKYCESELRRSLNPRQFRLRIGRGDYVQFRIMARLPWRLGSAYVHGTAHAIAGHFDETEKGELLIGRTVNDEERAWTMYLANFCTFDTLRIANWVLGGKKDTEWQRAYKDYLEEQGVKFES
jgi:hypothetical protein